MAVSIRLVWDMSPKSRFGLLREPTGLACPSCGTRLQIGQAWSVVILALAPFVIIVLTYAAERVFVLGDAFRVAGGIGLIALFVFSSQIGRQFATLRVRRGISTVDFPIERVRRQMLEPAAQESEDVESTELRVCPSCGKSTPASSSVCGHCDTYDANAI